MKKLFFVLLALVLLPFFDAIAEDNADWSTAPVIIKAYEQAEGKLYVEWTGNATLYQVFLDGNKISDVIVNHQVININKGTHTIMVYPVYELRDISTKMDLQLNATAVGGGLSLDLASLGLDPKHLYAGVPSDAFRIDYRPSQILNRTPEGLAAYTDPENRVVLSFEDQYNADEYLLTVRHKNDVNYLSYLVSEDFALISKTNANTSVILDPAFLKGQECMVPELNEEYKFTVQLRKYSTDLITKEKEKSVILESKASGEYAYRVTAAWKKAPVITFASQTADGEITLQWDHEDYGIGCKYAVMKINKVLGVMTGEEQLGITDDHTLVIKDLINGGYCINIVPVFDGEKGSYSTDTNVEVKNEWVAAPELNCEQEGDNQVKLSWNASANIHKYHIVVYIGDSNSLLSFVDLDYNKYVEFDIDSVAGYMEYIYTYDKAINSENGLKMKFEINGVRYTESGSEQLSSTSSRSIVLK